MKNFALFEECLARHPGVAFWWRDDDVGVGSRRHPIANWIANRRLKKMLTLAQQYGIYSIFAAIPYKFSSRGKKQINLIKKYNANVALHGIQHKNNSCGSGASEFPDGLNVAENLTTILEYKKEFLNIFQDRFMPIFVPPWNTLSKDIEVVLLRNGLYISRSNDFHSIEYDAYNIDVDMIDWYTRGLRDEETILQEIIALVESGRKSIGLMGHHKVANGRAFLFFDNLFEIIARHRNKDAEDNNPWRADGQRTAPALFSAATAQS
jgi:hypothetical protein